MKLIFPILMVLALGCLIMGCRQKEKPAQSDPPLPEPLLSVTPSPDDTDSSGIPADERAYKEGQACIFEKASKKMSEMYPFNATGPIELVAFGERDRMKIREKDLLRNGVFTVPAIRQRVTLSSSQRDSLFSILMNFRRIEAQNGNFGADCYRPQHAILFNANGKTVAFYEICFSCGKVAQSPGVDLGLFCEEKLCMLKRFFKAAKVDWGMDDDGRCE